MCDERHYCPNCGNISLFDADDGDLNHCRCGADDDDSIVARIEGGGRE